jgi:hypothetical protein
MTMRITAFIAAAAMTLALSACGSNESTDAPSTSMNDKGMDKNMTDKDMGIHRPGSFFGLNGKKVSGKVSIADGKVVLSEFASDEGPDLHLYLTNGDDSAAVAAGQSLGEVEYDERSQTFELDGINADDYDTVVVNCDKARAVFGAAELP